jgi:hypothetical protein
MSLPQIAPEIKVFLASSSELELERVHVGDFFNDINSILADTPDTPVRIRLLKWEVFDPSYKGERKQALYNRQIEEADIFIALFRTKEGKYTIEEAEVASISHTQVKKPQELYCLLQASQEERAFDVSGLESRLGANYVFGSFADIADLKLKLMRILWSRLCAYGVVVTEARGFIQINSVNILKMFSKNS